MFYLQGLLPQFPCRSVATVLFVIFASGLFTLWWPSLSKELTLLYHCHLNDTHRAQEITRLATKVEKLRNEVEEMREEKRQCLNDNDMEHSAANRSFWGGVMTCVCVEVAITFSFVLWWCCYLFCAPRPPPRQVRQYLI